MSLARPAISTGTDGDGRWKEVQRMLSIVNAGYSYLRARFPKEDGAVATEYGLLLVLIALAIVLAAGALGVAIANVFSSGEAELSNIP
jgi:Flp pilus assembly pilin Flp